MDKIYNISEFGELINKSVITLQRWDREGILHAYRSPSNRRYYTHTQYLEYIGKSSITENKQNVIYCRVSNRNQKEDLNNQIQFMMNYTKNNGIPINNIYSDYGSGLNYHRKNWNRLIDDCISNKISKIYISYKDRFVRFGYEWICEMLKKYTSVEVITVENIISSPEKDLIDDLVSIIHVFSCRIYSLRKYARKVKKYGKDS